MCVCVCFLVVMAQQLAEELSNFERYLRYRRPVDFQFRPSDKTFVWVPDGKGAFYTAEVLKEEGDNVKVLITETGQVQISEGFEPSL